MQIYKAKEDIISGVIPNTNGQPNILFKKGDEIIGETFTKYISNQWTKGILAKPTVSTAYVETPDGLVFVPFSEIDIDIKGFEPVSPEERERLQSISNAESKKEKYRTYAFWGIPTVATIYGINGMRKLPDYKPNEALLTGLSVATGAASLFLAAASGFGGGNDKKAENLGTGGVFIGASGILYSVSRGIFKMNTKNSLIFSVAAAAIFTYITHNKTYQNTTEKQSSLTTRK